MASFDKFAPSYDSEAWIQSRLAIRVLARSEIERPRTILELGCGTGILTRGLLRRFPSASIVATDLSPRMLTEARLACGVPELHRLRLGMQDARGGKLVNPLVSDYAPYDLIVSNALVQWLPDIGAHLRFTRKLVAANGWHVFSTFTRSNLPELNGLLRAPPFSYTEFPGWDSVVIERAAAETGWSIVSLSEDEDRVTLPSALAVLRQLQAMGASRDPRHGGRLTRRTLARLLAAYAERHAVSGGVSLTWRSSIVSLRTGTTS